VDYARILPAVEAESDVILWDGGNNDYSFIRPGLLLVVADALRPGHEVSYYPGETNLRSADVVVINKVADAWPGDVAVIRRNVHELNGRAKIVEAARSGKHFDMAQPPIGVSPELGRPEGAI
jgi:predicted GTPase